MRCSWVELRDGRELSMVKMQRGDVSGKGTSPRLGWLFATLRWSLRVRTDP